MRMARFALVLITWLVSACSSKASEPVTVTPVTPNSITCGTQSCDLASIPGCCDDPASPASCTSACAVSLYRCDGSEDCGGNACCGDVATGGSACAATTTCGAPQEVYCHANTDCPSAKPMCAVQNTTRAATGDGGSPLGAVIAVCVL
jgi:hypothetical protein